jgi:DNA ligase-1
MMQQRFALKGRLNARQPSLAIRQLCENDYIHAPFVLVNISFDNGIFLPDLDLWLDPGTEQSIAFVSHAHSDHTGYHPEVILSEITARLMAARLPGKRIEHALPFHSRFQFRDASITLLPAGHILGSAQIYVENGEGASLLYTGDFKLRPGKSAEAIAWRSADTLIMETTFGLPRYVFPPVQEVIGQLITFCMESIGAGQIPILFGYSLGKAQEILAALHEPGFRVFLHPAVYEMTRLYQDFYQSFPTFELYTGKLPNGSILICPPGANRMLISRIENRRTAMLTGWALDPGAVYRYQCDALFPLSDHADYTDLMRYVELVQPKRVFTVHGFASQFAQDLRRRGIEAWALGEDHQLELPGIPA